MGRVGRGSFGKASHRRRAPVLSPSPLPGLLRDATDVATGVAAFRDRTVRTWGSNSFGSLGTGGSMDAVAPRSVLVRSLSSIVRVWSGGNRALALKSDGSLYRWGPSGSESAGVFRVSTVIATPNPKQSIRGSVNNPPDSPD